MLKEQPNNRAAYQSRYDHSSIKRQKPMPVKMFYLQLIPAEFNYENVAMGQMVKGVYYTNDERQFWRKP